MVHFVRQDSGQESRYRDCPAEVGRVETYAIKYEVKKAMTAIKEVDQATAIPLDSLSTKKFGLNPG